VLSCAEIRQIKESGTDAQWDEYRDSLEGVSGRWQATISNVGDNGWLTDGRPIHMDWPGEDCRFYYEEPNEAKALTYNKGQLVTIIGRVNFVSAGPFGGAASVATRCRAADSAGGWMRGRNARANACPTHVDRPPHRCPDPDEYRDSGTDIHSHEDG